MKNLFMLLCFAIFSGLFFAISDSEDALALKTGSYNFCEVFPAFSECGGWRNIALSDNYWFCDYVDLDQFCNADPDPDKKILPLSDNGCCRFLGPPLETLPGDTPGQILTPEQLELLRNANEPVAPAIIWTDRDHYDFVDKVTIFGKLNFTNISIEQNLQDLDFIQTGSLIDNSTVVELQLNGRKIIRDLPVNENGWFSAVHFLDNRYHFGTQTNLLEVEYVITSGVIPPAGPQTHATYHFTTGNIAKKEPGFDIWIDDALMPNAIRYGVTVENAQRFIDLDRYNFVITRLVTPSGHVIPVPSDFAIKDLSAEYDGFKEFGRGTYEIQITYGSNTAKKSFVY